MKYFLLMIIVLTVSVVSACGLSESARKNAAFHFQMGQSHLGENNITAALVEFTEAEKINPKDPELLNYLGFVYYLKNRYDIAEQKYLKALELKPKYPEVRNKLGVNYMEMKRWDDAIQQFKIATEDIFYQNQGAAVVNLGLAYLGKGEYEQALIILRSAVSSNPRDPGARLSLGRVYFALEKTELAIAEFKRAVELNGSYANAYYYLAMCHLKNKDNKAAVAAFKEVLRIAPDSEIGQLSKEYLEMFK
jgi:Tfp pilus assembly protein PilF